VTVLDVFSRNYLMGYSIVDLLPLLVGAAVVPLYAIAVLLLLLSKGVLRKAFAFVAGGVTERSVQGLMSGG
jgi:hypothetical protein